MKLNISNHNLAAKYPEKTVKIAYADFKSYKIRYAVLNDQNHLPNILFIHGAPGYIHDMKNYFNNPHLLENARIITYDRPGYGQSNLGKPLVSIQEQVDAAIAILRKEKVKNVIVVGHSFGGPIAAKLTVDLADVVDGLVLLAPALDPEQELIFKIAYFAKIPVIKHLIPTSLQVAAAEKFAHADELKKLIPAWSEIKVPVVYVHGTNDWIVPYGNMEFAKNHFNPENTTYITLKGTNHFINFNPKKEILDSMRQMITRKTQKILE